MARPAAHGLQAWTEVELGEGCRALTESAKINMYPQNDRRHL